MKLIRLSLLTGAQMTFECNVCHPSPVTIDVYSAADLMQFMMSAPTIQCCSIQQGYNGKDGSGKT